MILNFCILVLCLILQLAKAELHLELVQVLFRHGDRTPRQVEIYPNDPYNVSTYEPWGLGQLTNKGKMREYVLGKMLRERYGNLLGTVYNPTDIYAVTTDTDRTKMSLQLVLAGLYPPNTSQTWNKKLPWMPIPIHYMPEKIDILLKGHVCPVYEKLLAEVRNTKEVQKKSLEYSDLYNFLAEKMGHETVESGTVYDMYHLLNAQKSMNLALPDWCTDEVVTKIEEVAMLDYEIRSYTPQLKRLHIGALIKKLLENIDVNQRRENPRKIYLYSAHEVNIAAYAKAHNFTEPKIPAFGSAFIFEKYSDDTGKHYVQILFWTGVTEELIFFKFPGCEEICPIETYLNIVKDVIPTEEENCFWSNLTIDELRKLYQESINLN